MQQDKGIRTENEIPMAHNGAVLANLPVIPAQFAFGLSVEDLKPLTQTIQARNFAGRSMRSRNIGVEIGRLFRG